MTLTLYEKVSLNFGSGVVAVALIGTLSYVSLGKLAIATRSAGDTEAVLEQVESPVRRPGTIRERAIDRAAEPHASSGYRRRRG